MDSETRDFWRAVVLWIIIMLLASLAVPTLGAQVNPIDFGAIPNDGGDDSAAFKDAYQTAIRDGVAVKVPSGVFDLAAFRVWVPEGKRLVVEGDSKATTTLRRFENKTFTQRISIKDKSLVRFANLELDGNRRSLESVPGEDQHHEIRIDGPGAPTLAEFQDLWIRDAIADGVQIVHLGLEVVKFDSIDFVGGDPGRRNLQISYHPKRCIVTNCVLDDFSTEPAGGSRNHHVDLLLSNSIIQGVANLQECGDIRVSNCQIGRLSQLTCSSGSMQGCTVESVGRFAVGPSHCTVRDSRWKLSGPLKVWSRFPRMSMDLLFDNVEFQADSSLGVWLETVGAQAAAPVRMRFVGCRQPRLPARVSRGYDVTFVAADEYDPPPPPPQKGSDDVPST